MATITPRPPGYAVEFSDPPPARIAPPGPDAAFIVGFFDRGTVCQARNVAALEESMGPRVNYSAARDDAAVQLAEGMRVLTAARVTGAAARAAQLRLNDASARLAITITATSVGAWANGATGGLEVEVQDAGDGTVRLIATEGGIPVATSPATDDVQDLVAWNDAQTIVIVTAAGSALPAVVSATALAGGDDDRANVRPSDWSAALALLDRRYGPGFLRAPGVTDPEIQELLHTHGDAFNRLPMDDTVNGVTKSDALEQAQTLQADMEEDEQRIGGLWASYAYARPITTEPERLVSYGAVQAGIAARVYRESGLRDPPFGITHGAARTVTRLAHEWSDDDRHDLYVAGINVATDDGTTIATWGYRTLDLDPLHCDLHHRFVRMALKWEAEAIAARYVGPVIDPRTQASFAGELDALCQRFAAQQALAAWSVDLATVNDDTTAAARERNALLHIRHTPTSDWVSIAIAIDPLA